MELCSDSIVATVWLTNSQKGESDLESMVTAQVRLSLDCYEGHLWKPVAPFFILIFLVLSLTLLKADLL